MAYGTKYTTTVWDFNGNNFIVNLKKLSYTGSTSTIKYFDPSPLTIKYDGSRDEMDLPVHGSDCDFVFYVDDATNYDEIFEGNYKDWILEVSGTTVYWLGYVKSENFIRPFIQPTNYFITLNAVDGLADLKDIDFPSTHVTGTTSVIQAVKYCLDQTGFNLPIKDQVNLTTTISSATPLFANLLIHLERFANNDNGVIVYTSCYDVLSQLLESFNAIITQENGYWLIQQKNEVVSYRNLYKTNNSGVITGATRTAYDRSIDISNYKFVMGSDELSKIVPNQIVSTTFQNKVLTGSTLSYNLMATNNGYTNVNYDAFFIGSVDVSVGELTPINTTTYEFYTHQLFYNWSTGNSLSMYVYINPTISITSGSGYPSFRFKITDPFGSTTTDTTQLLTAGNHIYHFIEPYTISTTGIYKITFDVIPNPTVTYSFIGGTFSAMTATINYPETTTHDLLIAQTNYSTNNPLAVVDETIYFSDAKTPLDVGALMVNVGGISGLSLTKGWSSYQASITKQNFIDYALASGNTYWLQTPNSVYGGGGGISWAGSSGNVKADNGGSGDYFSKIIYQTGMTNGNYNLSVTLKNDTTVVAGTNPNVTLNVYLLSGGTWTKVAQANLTSGAGYQTKTFNSIVVSSDITAIGFFVYSFGATTDLNVTIDSATVTSFTSNEWQTPHSTFYDYLKNKKRYRYSDFLKLTVYSNQNIFFNSIPIINGKKYEICGYNYDVLNRQIELQMAEFIDKTILVSTSVSTLNSVDGQTN